MCIIPVGHVRKMIKKFNEKYKAYDKGKIYKIYNIKHPVRFYVGSTILRLKERMNYHKKKMMKCNSYFYEEMRREGFENFRIVLQHNYPCCCRDELRKEENRVIELINPYYNTRRAYVSEEQRKECEKKRYKKYYENNKEKIKKRKKEYHKRNKAKIKERMKTYYENNKQKRKCAKRQK